MKYKQNLRPNGRLLTRYLTALSVLKEFEKGLTRNTLDKIHEKLFASFLSHASEYEIIERLRELERNFFHCKDTFKKYLKAHYGISKLPK